MIDHIGITVSDLQKSRMFYLTSLKPLGYTLIHDTPTSISFGIVDGDSATADPGGDFWLSFGIPMVPRVHFAFRAATHLAVDAFFAAGIAAGGTDNGPPGLRPKYHANYYAAFLLDPDGYPLEAVCHFGTDHT